MTEATYWRKCTSCKKPIGFHQKYWICSVSTCNRVRTGLFFCSVSCFDAHVPVMNHKDAGAFEKRSPTEAQYKAEQVAASAPPVPRATSAPPKAPNVTSTSGAPRTAAPSSESIDGHGVENEILTVTSKVKAYIRERSGMNTSDAVMSRVSRHIRRWADDAIRRAAQEERQTVLDRDVR